MWSRRKPESIWVDATGLADLIRDINYDVGMSELSRGPWIQVRPGHYENNELFLVTLAPHLIDRLSRRVRQYEFSDVYRSGANGGSDESR